MALATAPAVETITPPPLSAAEVKDHLSLIADMTLVFSASHSFDAVAKSALERVAKYVGAEASSFFMLDDQGQALVCTACYGPVDITGLRLPSTAGIVGRCVQSQEARIVRDVRKDADFGAVVDAKTGFVTKSILVAPLSVGRERLGAIEVINKNIGDNLFSESDLALLHTLSRAAALAIHNLRLTDKLVEQERERHELELAAEIQRDLLPQASPKEFPIHGINVPARAVSGDFYDILQRPDGRIWFNIADVSGKGMNAALLMAKTSSLFRCLAKSAEHPGQLLNAINNELCETNSHGMFVTMVGGLFDPTSGIVRLTNAGHEPPLLFDIMRESFMSIPADAPPLGIATGIAGPDGFPVIDVDLKGGSLYVFTDGLTEATTFGGGMLGLDGVRALIRDHAEESPDLRLKHIAGAVKLPGKPLRDDLTLIVVEDNGVRTDPPKPPGVPFDSTTGVILRVRVPGQADRLKLIRNAVTQAASFCSCDEAWTLDLVMAVDEACQNIIRHAYGGVEGAGDIVADFVRDGDSLSVFLMDFAPPVDPGKIKSRDINDVRPGGLGVHLIKSVTDDARFLPPPPGVGNLFKLTKRLPPKVDC
ncbi:MAG: SpoIIE family protein phosphatase [Rhodospirillaceae bacterium]|nr:SpoIIE family protein phosphatase [Rhodospirillaceae bacterium]